MYSFFIRISMTDHRNIRWEIISISTWENNLVHTMCQNGKETQVRYFQRLLPGFQRQDGLPARNGIRRFTSGAKPRTDVTKSPKHERYQWPHKKDWCTPKKILKHCCQCTNEKHTHEEVVPGNIQENWFALIFFFFFLRQYGCFRFWRPIQGFRVCWTNFAGRNCSTTIESGLRFGTKGFSPYCFKHRNDIKEFGYFLRIDFLSLVHFSTIDRSGWPHRRCLREEPCAEFYCEWYIVQKGIVHCGIHYCEPVCS